MKNNVRRRVFSCWGWRGAVGALVVCICGAVGAVDLRSSADGRAWSVLLQADENLQWRWADGATTATLTASNLLTGVTATSEPVARGTAVDASCAIPATGGETARLVDVTLTQFDGETVVETRTARLRIGQPSTSLAVDATDKSFRAIREPQSFAWSDVWAGLDATTATLTVVAENGTAIGTWTLPSTGGYGVIRPKVELGARQGKPTVSVGFDETAAALVAELWYLNFGTTVLLR